MIVFGIGSRFSVRFVFLDPEANCFGFGFSILILGVTGFGSGLRIVPMKVAVLGFAFAVF